MVTKSQQKPSKKKSSKNRVKVLDLKRETLKDLTESQKKKIKGRGGRGSTIDPGCAYQIQ